MRKVISLIVVLMLFFSSVPATVFAEEHNNQVTEEISSDSNSTDVSQETEVDNIDTVTEDQIQADTPEAGSDSPAQQEDEFVVQEEAESSTDKKVTEEKPVQQSEDTETPTEEKAEIEVQESAAKEQEEEQPKYNELGIKEGTMVYGIDISKLSAEELQYIPIDWRDGVDETEEESASEPRLYARASYPNVNDWIKKNSPSTASIKYEHKSQFAKFNYRYGRGAVEGVVAHETANPNSSIRSEINYMTANHNNAFVHAFVDHNNIIEIHPTDLGAWGAGYYANQRFVHVELVEVNNFENFAKSINNYADYIAYVLAKYDLGVTSAESNGRGTLWSHSAVSRFLGGTNHVDPHGYFAKYGYNWNDFVKLVTEKYNQKAIKYSSTSKLGHIRTIGARVYPNLSNLSSSSQAGTSKTNQVYYIKKQANVNGTIYYLLSTKPSATSGTIGWMKARDVKVHDHKGLNRDKYMYTIVGTGAAYDKAWGGSKNQVYNLASMKGQIFTSNLSETVGKNTWIRGTLKGKEVWVHSSYVTDKRKESNTSKLGHLRTGAKIYTEAKNTAKYRNATSSDYNQVYYIKKQIERDGQLFYLISYEPSSSKGVVGWVKAEQMQTHSHTGVSKTAQTIYLTGSGKSYNKAWGGSKNLVSSNLSASRGKTFKVNLTEKVGNNVWYRGTLDGKQMWLHSSYVSTMVESKTSSLGHLRAEALILTAPGVTNGAKKAANGYTNEVYYIKKQVVFDKKTYYLISYNPSSTTGTLGWVEAGQMQTHSHTGVSKTAQTLYLTGSGKSYTKAWGGSKNLVSNDLTASRGKAFQVNLTEKVGNNIWYRGTLDGKQMWLHSSYVSTKKESKTS
ncbi:GW dipeptide domain-containing protein [Terribacillus saccharophilus]|uniref:GW dipeptide domain-containing protein n=1 Tax=Terribacillus saccharophilus TaxID=361277 RepID=UPI00298A003C|nr:GW dipeptide domain-containing protein [Terribacillus saccharophilus]MCM3225281.1 N-acetylmuramoyl-L-alanine amidase [Terribacillus saccharophilus]